jgi:hypothetical protein
MALLPLPPANTIEMLGFGAPGITKANIGIFTL